MSKETVISYEFTFTGVILLAIVICFSYSCVKVFTSNLSYGNCMDMCGTSGIISYSEGCEGDGNSSKCICRDQ